MTDAVRYTRARELEQEFMANAPRSGLRYTAEEVAQLKGCLFTEVTTAADTEPMFVQVEFQDDETPTGEP